jgi:hypothetical protein
MSANGSHAFEGPLLGEDFNPWKDRLLSASILYIGNLPADCSREELHCYLSRFDRVVWIKISHDDKNSSGYYYAHAILKTVGGYERLLTYPLHKIRQMKLRVKMNGSSPVFSKYEELLNQRKVFVKRLSRTMTCEKLRQHFSRFGTVEDVDIPVNREDNSSRRIAFVTFREEEDAERCAQVKKQKINGVEVICKKYKPTEISSVKEESSGLRPSGLAPAARVTDCEPEEGQLLAHDFLEQPSEAQQNCPGLPGSTGREMSMPGCLGADEESYGLMQTRYPSELSATGPSVRLKTQKGPSSGFSMDAHSKHFAQQKHPSHKDSLESGDPCQRHSSAILCPSKQAEPRAEASEAVRRTSSRLDTKQHLRPAVVFFKASGFTKVSQSPSGWV